MRVSAVSLSPAGGNLWIISFTALEGTHIEYKYTLRSADFFDVEKFPKASFRSTKIEADTAKSADGYIVTGDFSLHGVTKSISFPATIKAGPDSVYVDAEFAVNRKDFGIVYTGTADDLIRDDVVIRLNLRAPRKK